MHIVIVEDEPIIAQRLQRQVSEILQDRNVRIKWFDNIDDAESYLEANVLDLLLLDLNLNGADGFELLKLVSAASFHTIIVSAYAEQAIRAFEFGVLDFVAKPFNQLRLSQAIDRLVDAESRSDYGVRQLAIKRTSGLRLIEVREILYAKADGHYTELVMSDGQTHLHDKSIDKLVKILPLNFERIHRSYIANMARTASIKIESGGIYQLRLFDGVALPISRSRYPTIRKKLKS